MSAGRRWPCSVGHMAEAAGHEGWGLMLQIRQRIEFLRRRGIQELVNRSQVSNGGTGPAFLSGAKCPCRTVNTWWTLQMQRPTTTISAQLAAPGRHQSYAALVRSSMYFLKRLGKVCHKSSTVQGLVAQFEGMGFCSATTPTREHRQRGGITREPGECLRFFFHGVETYSKLRGTGSSSFVRLHARCSRLKFVNNVRGPFWDGTCVVAHGTRNRE